MTSDPGQIEPALAFFDALPGCSDTQKHGKVLAGEVRALRADVNRHRALVEGLEAQLAALSEGETTA